MLNNYLLTKVSEIFNLCHKYNLRIRTAESCSGGALAYLFTQLPGSSEFFDHGIVSYSNESKHELLNIPIGILDEHGAVSHKTATCMVESISGDNILSISTTGILGPKSDEKNTAIGTVYIGINICKEKTLIKKCIFGKDRNNNHIDLLETTLNFILLSLKNKTL